MDRCTVGGGRDIIYFVSGCTVMRAVWGELAGKQLRVRVGKIL